MINNAQMLRDELQTVTDDPSFNIDKIIMQLEALPATVKAAGEEVDKAKSQKALALQRLNEAKTALEMAKSAAVLNMPEGFKNEMQRTAYVTGACKSEIEKVNSEDAKVMAADTDIQYAQRELQFQQDLLTSAQRKAEMAAMVFRYLSAR